MSMSRQAIHLREATLDDCRFLHELRNDPVVRAASFSTAVIDFEIHQEWFHHKLKASDSIILIAEIGSQKIGQLRLDMDSQFKSAELSIALAPEFRGQGFGTDILKSGVQLAFHRYPITQINAFIRRGNEASQKIFSSAGFIFSGVTRHKDRKCILMTLERS